MKKLILVTALALLALTAGRAPAQDSRTSMPANVGPGRVAWFDIATKDLAKAKAFYGELFGWQFAPVMGSDFAAEIVVDGASIGTIRVADGDISMFNGVVYIQVADARASCARAKELGATIAPGFPFNLPNGTGAIGLFVDPTGHPIGVYARTPLPVKAPAGK